jgi:hypothetical protein
MKYLGLFMIFYAIACSSHHQPKVAKELGTEKLPLSCEASEATTHLAFVGLQGPGASEPLTKDILKELNNCGCHRWQGPGDENKMCVGYREGIGRQEILTSDNNSLYEVTVNQLTASNVSFNVKLYKVARPGRPGTRDLYQFANPGQFTREIKGEMTAAKAIADTIERLTFK